MKDGDQMKNHPVTDMIGYVTMNMSMILLL